MARRRTADESSATLKLTGGAMLTLTFRGNLFDMTPDEQKLIGDLSGIIRTHAETQGETPEPVAAAKPETERRRRVRDVARKPLQSRSEPLHDANFAEVGD
jgi:hypothetical protein